jgi:hypothetical protein
MIYFAAGSAFNSSSPSRFICAIRCTSGRIAARISFIVFCNKSGAPSTDATNMALNEANTECGASLQVAVSGNSVQ